MENNNAETRMDFSLETPEERNEKVKQIIANTPSEKLTPLYLEKLADYLIFAMDKQERRNKKILTDNHMVTVNRRETSFEGLIGKLENGEDGIYNMITNDKNIIFRPKSEITEQDIAEIPALKTLRDEISRVEKELAGARGKRAYLLKKSLIEMRQDQYIIRGSYKKTINASNLIRSIPKLDLAETVTLDPDGNIASSAIINFFEPEHISALLCNYSKLKEESWEKLNNDAKWLMEDLDTLVDKTLKEKYPLYYDILIYKIDGLQNAEIQQLLFEKYDILHSVEYISSLWRKKIPKLLAEQATKDWLEWHYTFEERGQWKKCSRCGQIKLAHSLFFSKNRTSRDGWYSICKDCRNAKQKKKNKGSE